MADFGVQATQLSAPQGAGANVVSPVQEGAVNTSMLGTIAGIGDLISSGIQKAMKSNAEQNEQSIIGGFSSEMQSINEALRSGAIKANEATARSQAVFGKYAASYPQYGESLTKMAASFKGYTEVGAAVKQVETEAEVRKSAILSAQGDGYTFFAGMSKEAEDAQIRAHQASKMAAKQYDDLLKRNQEKRAQGTYDRDVAKEETRQVSIRIINDIAGGQMDSTREFAVSLGQQVKNGKVSPEEAKALVTDRFGKINLAIQSAAGLNPEMAAPYRTIFGDLQRLSEQLIDPKAQNEAVANQIDAIINRQKLVALQDPTAAKAVATSQLFGQNAQVLLSNSPVVAQTITRMLSTSPDGFTGGANVVGNPEVEKATFQFLKKSISSVGEGRFADNEAAKQEVNTSIRHMLKQTSEMLGRGADAKTLQEAAAFFSSAEYGKWASENKMSPEEQSAAYRTFQIVYEPTVIKGIEKRLNETFSVFKGKTEVLGPGVVRKKTESFKLDKDMFSVTFNGSGVVFGIKEMPTDPAKAREANETLRSLRSSQEAVNQLIRIGSHMEGTTNYAKAWEDNKHVYLPMFFSKYQGLEIGQEVNGMKYKGGDPKDPNSWGQ